MLIPVLEHAMQLKSGGAGPRLKARYMPRQYKQQFTYLFTIQVRKTKDYYLDSKLNVMLRKEFNLQSTVHVLKTKEHAIDGRLHLKDTEMSTKEGRLSVRRNKEYLKKIYKMVKRL